MFYVFDMKILFISKDLTDPPLTSLDEFTLILRKK